VVKFLPLVLTRDAEQRAAVVVGQLERMRPATYEHSKRVAALAVRVARHAKLPPSAITDVHWGGLLHDIGELNLRRSLLDKPTTLDAQERAQIVDHTLVGARWLASIPGLAPLVPFARWHHERFDGGGYPDGCNAQKVPLTVALVAVCDAWDAMTEPRPYREPLSTAEAIAEMHRNAGRQWSKALVNWTLDCLAKPPDDDDAMSEPLQQRGWGGS